VAGPCKAVAIEVWALMQKAALDHYQCPSPDTSWNLEEMRLLRRVPQATDAGPDLPSVCYDSCSEEKTLLNVRITKSGLTD
jgi:hypothetical protein